jgi:hypothetical protein
MKSLFITVVAIRDRIRGVTQRNFSQSLGIGQGQNGNWQCLGPNIRGFNNRKNLEKKCVTKLEDFLFLAKLGVCIYTVCKIYKAKQSAKREVQVN